MNFEPQNSSISKNDVNIFDHFYSPILLDYATAVHCTALYSHPSETQVALVDAIIGKPDCRIFCYHNFVDSKPLVAWLLNLKLIEAQITAIEIHYHYLNLCEV